MKKNYTKYDAIDFAEDASFIRWAQGEDPKAATFWEDWNKSNPNKSTTLKEAKVIVQSIQIEEEEPSAERIQGLWNKIDAVTKETSKAEAVIRPLNRRRWISYAVAASISLLAFFYFYNPDTSVSIGNGEHLAYILPDNSKVELNADSKITFNEGSFEQERIIELEGEAFFKVEKGAAFKVITPNGTVEVLGTSFNVNTRNGGLEVDCKTGKVRVSSKKSSQILTEGLGTKLNAQKSALENTYSTDIDKKTGWINRDFYLTNVTFSKVIEELERQYDVQIECEQGLRGKIGDYVFSGDLNNALTKVCFQLNANYVISRKKVTITVK